MEILVMKKLTLQEKEFIKWTAQVELYNRIYLAMFEGSTSDPLEVARIVLREMKSIRNELSLYEQSWDERN